MIKIIQTDTFKKWENKLKDPKARAIIAARLFRLANGIFGDLTSVGDSISELRIHYGPGYRIYLKPDNNEIIILLCAGNKTSQKRDIEKAKKIAFELKHQPLEKNEKSHLE
jgi:putative addiction module killer protein